MKVYTNATIKITERNSFENEKGETIEFGSVYLKDKENNVLKVSSGKNDFSKYEGNVGVAVMNVREENGKIKVSLVDFKDEEEIAY